MNTMYSNNLQALNPLLLTTFEKGKPEIILHIDSTFFVLLAKKKMPHYPYQSNGFHLGYISVQ